MAICSLVLQRYTFLQAMNHLSDASPRIQPVHDPRLAARRVQLSVLRLDEIHPMVSGNKWYKLKYNLQQARQGGYDTLLTVGGAYSNHLYATAAAGRASGFKTIGVVRGEAHPTLNPTLQFCQDQGMRLHYVSRADFQQRGQPSFREALQEQFGRHYFLPEGGSNALAVQGCTEIVGGELPFEYVACCVGTAGTLAGIVTGTAGKTRVLGFVALKGGEFLSDEVDRLTRAYNGNVYDHYRLVHDYHFGGYARVKPELIDFINTFYRTTGIPLEPLYTGKMLYGLYEIAERGCFPAGSRILAVHSGGLQGIAGFNQRYQSRNLRILA